MSFRQQHAQILDDAERKALFDEVIARLIAKRDEKDGDKEKDERHLKKHKKEKREKHSRDKKRTHSDDETDDLKHSKRHKKSKDRCRSLLQAAVWLGVIVCRYMQSARMWNAVFVQGSIPGQV